MKTHFVLFICFVVLLFSCGGNSSTRKIENKDSVMDESSILDLEPRIKADFIEDIEVTKIAFGSCGNQDKPWPILDKVLNANPDVFVFLGDNIYGDTKVMDTLKAKYNRLGNKENFQTLMKNTKVLATWDDHDFGWNDSGRHYKFKEESKEIFLDFWKEPTTSPRRERKGIYSSYCFNSSGKTVQIILLDTRTFRDNLQLYNNEEVDKEAFHYELDYWPNENQDSTFLGNEQWAWLEAQLSIPADLRIIGSSTQFGISYNGYEAWANVPIERQKLIDLISDTRAENVVFISGDVHYAEVSEVTSGNCYTLYDFTSSGITSTWKFATPNENRVDGPIMENHFGMLTIDLENNKLIGNVIDIDGNTRITRDIDLDALKF